jgi:hypothetical protein
VSVELERERVKCECLGAIWRVQRSVNAEVRFESDREDLYFRGFGACLYIELPVTLATVEGLN